MATLTGDYPPTDAAGFMAFAASVPVPEFVAALTTTEALSDAYGYRRAANRMRHYQQLPRYRKAW
ncbi:MAG: hypothetical protein HC822_09490 [Oscillochloris sp.]|nr:hypothetical protein [Oscillochloris sp.]